MLGFKEICKQLPPQLARIFPFPNSSWYCPSNILLVLSSSSGWNPGAGSRHMLHLTYHLGRGLLLENKKPHQTQVNRPSCLWGLRQTLLVSSSGLMFVRHLGVSFWRGHLFFGFKDEAKRKTTIFFGGGGDTHTYIYMYISINIVDGHNLALTWDETLCIV